jgi:hypothetical protein
MQKHMLYFCNHALWANKSVMKQHGICICQYFTAFPEDIFFACLIEKSYGVNLLSLSLLLYQVLEGL